MPFIPTEKVKEIRKEIKKQFPEFKFSIRREHYSTVNIIFKSGPVQLLLNPDSNYEMVNHFYVSDHYADHPEARDIIQKVIDIARNEQHEVVYDGDYGSIPNYYINVSVGEWNKKYQVINK